MNPAEERYNALAPAFPHWEKTGQLIEQCLDITLNYRQSGHPGGSRSKLHALLATLLSGVLRWDIRHPEKRFGDRFVLGAGHTVPLVYATLAVLNEALRVKHRQTGDARYAVARARQLCWEDLLGFRRRGGLSGHAEMEGKSLFLKFNTGPSGHGSPAAAGQALALKRAGAEGVKVFILEGEGGLTPGVTHETLNSAWGLALDNLYYVVDWNDYGIDEHRVSSAVYGSPREWFGAHGWRVYGTEQGSDWGEVTRTLLAMVNEGNPEHQPSVAWFKTRKGRGYLTYDYASHGVPHKLNSEKYWQLRKDFAARHGARFVNVDGAAPADAAALRAEFEANLRAVIEVLHRDQALVDYLAGRLVELGDSVPREIPGFRLGGKGNPFEDKRLYDYRGYPQDLYLPPGSSAPNRAALARWGAWVNSFGAREYGRPLFLASSADLAESTNIAGFAKGDGGFAGYGWYGRHGSPEGALLSQEITEFANAGIMAGLASVNLAENPEERFDGFWGATSTYGSFSYLVYGPLRLYSQLAQDCQLKLGRLLFVAGHSGPETAEDSRTHFGVFAPGVTRLFPKGAVLNLHPWEHNEVPVLLGAALATGVPIIALHLTRPPFAVPDRRALGLPSHFEAARGAYVVREADLSRPRGGTVFVQGTSAMAGIVRLLPEVEKLNLKVVCVTSSELFARQGAVYRRRVLGAEDRADSTVITTQARALMQDWLFNTEAEEYALSADWDDRWRTGGTLEEVLDEAHLTPRHLLAGLRRFAKDRGKRLRRLGEELSATAARPEALRRRKRSTSAARPGSGARTPPRRPRPGPGPRRSAEGRPGGRAAKSR
jgi:transketolase